MVDEAPMKPQDTVIFLLGELKGSVQSLHQSVDNSNRAQADINKANEEEHAKFRQTLNSHDTALAVLSSQDSAKRENRLSRIQLWGIWVGAPSGLAALIGLLAYVNFNH